MLSLILLVFAFLLCLIQALWFGARSAPPNWCPHFGWLGMALWFLSLILTAHNFGHL